LTNGSEKEGMRTITKSLILALAAVGGLLVVGSAHAHANYLRSEPGDGAIIAEPPQRVDVWFTQDLFRRQGENWIRVFGPNGDPVHAGEAQIDDDDRRHMWVRLTSGLDAGAYRVEWRTLSAEDGDADEGVFTFTLDPQAAVTSTPMPGATPTVVPTPSLEPATTAPTPVPATPPGGGCPAGLAPLAGLIGLTVLRRSRRPAPSG
jgi:methionine-rich copper-binding protein CopC